jgi:xylulokinase
MLTDSWGWILAIDVGTSTLKTGLFGGKNRCWIGIRRSVVAGSTIQRGWSEQDPESWWRILATHTLELRTLFPKEMDSLVTVGVTGHMHAVVFLDGHHEVLRPAIVLSDRRAEAEHAELITETKHFYTVTGARLDRSSVPPKIRWVQQNEPEVYRAAELILGVKDYINLRLTGIPATDPTEAAGSLLYDLLRSAWSVELSEQIAPDLAARLPEIRPSASILGTLRSESADELNLPSDVPVVTGAGDDVEIHGSGISRFGDCYEHLGTTGSLFVMTDSPVFDPEMRIELYPDAFPGRYLLGGSVTSAGAALEWAERVYHTVPTYERIPELIFLPFIDGSRSPLWNVNATGGFLGLTSEHDAQALVEAVAAGVALSMKHIEESVGAIGVPLERIFTTGGCSDNRDFARWRSLLYDLPIIRNTVCEATLHGIAMLAGYGIGMWDLDAVPTAETAWETAEQKDDGPDRESLHRLYERYKEALDRLF